MSDTFDRAFALVLGEEGRLSMVPSDPGNWTGGKVNVGELRGTDYGLSAAVWYGKTSQWPPTLNDARGIYKPAYWDKIAGDSLPPPVALVVFDAAVNSGPDRAARWLQAACGANQDGVVGPNTLKAASAKSTLDLVTEINAQRLLFLTGLPTWRTFGLGWTRRIVHLGIAATGFEAAPVVTVQTINPGPVVASLDDVLEAFRKIQAEKVAA